MNTGVTAHILTPQSPDRQDGFSLCILIYNVFSRQKTAFSRLKAFDFEYAESANVVPLSDNILLQS